MRYLSTLFTAGATQQQLEVASKKLNLPMDKIQELVNKADPTPDNKYEAWILRQWANKHILLPEDTGGVKNVLQNFIVYSRQNKLQHKDINRYKKIHDLEAELDKIKGVTYDERQALTIEDLNKMPGVKASKGNFYVIAAISDVNSLEILGLGTKWCTREDYLGGSMAQRYINRSRSGNVFIVYEEETDGNLKRLYQFTDDFSEFKDVTNDDAYPDAGDRGKEEIIYILKNKMDIEAKENMLFKLYLEMGDVEKADNLLNQDTLSEISPEYVEEYLNQMGHLYGFQDYPEQYLELAIKYKVEPADLDYVYDSVSDLALYARYAVEVTQKPNGELEIYLFADSPNIEDYSILWDYCKEFVLEEINTPYSLNGLNPLTSEQQENLRQEVEEENEERRGGWQSLFEDGIKTLHKQNPQYVIEIAKDLCHGESFVFNKYIQEHLSEEWPAYEQWLLQQENPTALVTEDF